MKKLISVIAAIMMVGAMAACGNTETVVEAKPVITKTGLGIVSNVNVKNENEDKGASSQVDTTSCAVTLDENGVIVGIKFDITQGKAEFDKEGEAVTESAKDIKSKKELGEDYHLKGVSSIGKEMSEQIVGLEEYAVGKKAEDVIGMELTETGAGVDLATSCTINIQDYLFALQKAVNNAK